jgi:hypothetical protein
MSGLVEIVITILVVGLIAWLLIFLIDYVPVPAPFNKVAKVVVMVVSVLVVIYALLGLTRTVPPLKMGFKAPVAVASR